MFILVFVVAFGTKKGTLATYSFAWYPLFTRSFSVLRNSTTSSLTTSKLFRTHLYRFQHTALTSRPTIYILTAFWCFFFFFGESLLLITFNYNTLTDLLQSGAFTFVKSHVIFMTDSNNAYLGDVVFFFILFFFSTAMAFLLNLRYSHSYLYTRSTALVDLGLTAILCYLFSPYAVVVFAVAHSLRSLLN